MKGAAVVVLALSLAACGRAPGSIRLRHEASMTSEWTLTQSEEAPHPLFGVGGELESQATVSLSCIGVEPDGSGQYEVTVRDVRLTAPPESGLAVDTSAKGPVPGDRIGATPVVLALLPRRAVVRVGTNGAVAGVTQDAAVAGHLGAWAKGKPVASQGAILRLHQALDPGPLAASWFQTVATLMPPDPAPAAEATWTSPSPSVDTPAGRLRTVLAVEWVAVDSGQPGSSPSRPLTAVLRGRGQFELDGPPSKDYPLEFRGGSVELTATIDRATGTLVAAEEKGRLEFVLRADGSTPAHWAWSRRLTARDSPR